MRMTLEAALQEEAFARLQSLDALGAIRAWLEDDYDYGEDRVLVQAIRRETGIALRDEAIWMLLSDAQATDASPSCTLADLLAANSADDSIVHRPR